MKRGKLFIMLATSALFAIGSVVTAFAGELTWDESTRNIMYLDDDGSYHHGWLDLDDKRYYFDENGYMVKGKGRGTVTTIDGLVYAFDGLGKMVTDYWATDEEGGEYLMSHDGPAVTGWLQGNGEYWINFMPWQTTENDDSVTAANQFDTSVLAGWHYFDPEQGGKMILGWKQIEGNWYYFDPDTHTYTDNFMGREISSTDRSQYGKMLTGLVNIDGVDYYFDDDGVLISQ